jgi:putative membrane-bound dehydrogenase-like protein
MLLVLWTLRAAGAAIEPAIDAPLPLSPEDSARQFHVPPGLRISLVASEPLIREPSGVCWDARGRLFVSELHGYNLEGHLDVQELNRTGVLDREVRRIPANPGAREAAMKETYGTVKLLADGNGDGRMDESWVFAERLPPVYGLAPAQGGVIAACAPDIVFLADRDGDNVAEVREVLFTGFEVGVLERAVNAPQWGVDNWIYFGSGHGGGTITGPRLPQPVEIGRTDFRIRADGSAIESVAGRTHTIGFAFTESGERFVTDTSSPGRYVTPIPWRYLVRNPNAAAPQADADAGGDRRVHSLARPHPWRVKRAEDPGFFQFYRERYGAGDSDPSGWFTSACSPLVYQDTAWPAAYHGAYLVCEPSGNLVHRAAIERELTGLRLHRPAEDAGREFLASKDSWFHPVQLAHGPDGAMYITDFYREIIEDYSAIPRYLQQQYGLVRGRDHGRIWRLAHSEATRAPSANMQALSSGELAGEIGSSSFWRRQTARRLLLERGDPRASSRVEEWLQQPVNREAAETPEWLSTAIALNALHTLQGLGVLRPAHVLAALARPEPGIRKHAVALSESWLDIEPEVWKQVQRAVHDPAPEVRLQVALSLGESSRRETMQYLAALARSSGDLPWMADALCSSVGRRAVELLEHLLLERTGSNSDGSLPPVLTKLARCIAAEENPDSIFRVLQPLHDAPSENNVAVLSGLAAGVGRRAGFSLPEAATSILSTLSERGDRETRRLAVALASKFGPRDSAVTRALVDAAALGARDIQLSPEARLEAIEFLAGQSNRDSGEALVEAWPVNTPKVQEAIVDALFVREERLALALNAIEHGPIPAGALNAVQRVRLLESHEPAIRQRATRVFGQAANRAGTMRDYLSALAEPRDLARGETVFREHCATCHRARGHGFAVGPDLDAELQRAEEAILKDVLAPNEQLTAGYLTYEVVLRSGETMAGTLGSESATSLTVKLPAGMEREVLLKDVQRVRTLPVSLMPEGLALNITPGELADVIAWLREPR